MDATEPDLVQPLETLDGQRTYANPTGMGTGARVLNGYSLVNSQGIYEGQRAAAPDQRVVHPHALVVRGPAALRDRPRGRATSRTTWTAMRKQIPAGLASRCPECRTGRRTPAASTRAAVRAHAADARRCGRVEGAERALVPVQHVHADPARARPVRRTARCGSSAASPIPAYQTELKFDRLRYRLLPYVYSLAGAVTHDADTMLRPLVMDFRSDLRAREIGDQYMFGPAFLVSPVTTYRARSRTRLSAAGHDAGTTSGRASPCTAASRSARPRRTTRCPCTFAPARSCPSVPSSNTPTRSRRIR